MRSPMPLSTDIRTLRDQTLIDLSATHDYFFDTQFAWRDLRNGIAAGASFQYQNPSTGTVTDHANLSSKVDGYIARQLAEATFQQFISIFEGFFFDFLRLWLTAYPRSLIGKKVDFKAILEAPDKD